MQQPQRQRRRPTKVAVTPVTRWSITASVTIIRMAAQHRAALVLPRPRVSLSFITKPRPCPPVWTPSDRLAHNRRAARLPAKPYRIYPDTRGCRLQVNTDALYEFVFFDGILSISRKRVDFKYVLINFTTHRDLNTKRVRHFNDAYKICRRLFFTLANDTARRRAYLWICYACLIYFNRFSNILRAINVLLY